MSVAIRASVRQRLFEYGQAVEHPLVISALAYVLSALLGVALAIDALVGLLVPSVYHDSPRWVAQARGVNVSDLFLALPTLIAAMLLARRGSYAAVLVLLGVLGYVLYNATIFAFEIAFNRLFLVYVALLALAAFGAVLLSRDIDTTTFGRRFGRSAPVRSVSAYLLVIAALFTLAWLKDIIPAIITDTTPASVLQTQIPTNPVYVLDLGFLMPLHVVAAVWLLRRHAGGYVLAGALLVLNLLLSLSIVSSTLFEYAIDPSVSLAIVPMFGLIALVSLVLAAWYFRGTSARTARP